MSKNPFQYLLPVSADDFVGRWPLVKRIAQDVLLEGGDSHALVAGRRCGKSSLLNVVAHHLWQASTAESGDWRALPLPFDFKSGSFDSVEAFFAQILDEVRRRVDVTERRPPKDAWLTPVRLDKGWFEKLVGAQTLSQRDFQDALGYILEKLDAPDGPVRLILLLDELDETLDYEWTEALFNHLRALIYSSDLKDRVRLVLSGSRRFLDEVSERGSPLWNVLKLHYLEAFDKSGLEQLTARAEDLSQEAAEMVWKQSGGHPFLAQYLLHYLWEAGLADADAAAVESLASRFLHERLGDVEGWARAADVAGLRAYAVLATGQDWIEERDIARAIDDEALDVKRGLIALSYQGLAVHDDGWSHFRRAGDLFKGWFDEQGAAFILKLEASGAPDVETEHPSQVVHVHQGDTITVGDVTDSKGIAIGRKSRATVTQGLTGEDVTAMFGAIYEAIKSRDVDADVDKDEIEEAVKKIEEEVAKAENANPRKIERLLKTLRLMAKDVFEVAAATWVNPAGGVGMVLKKIVDRVAAEG